MEKDDVIIEGESNLLNHATDYYRDLFGPEPGHDITIEPDLWEGCKKLDEADNKILCQPFSDTEIKSALFQMEKNKAPGPDKISIEFYQCCWDIVKHDIVALFNDFHDGRSDISRLNYGIITLLPKIKDASKIQQFRPICLLNCLYKLITKVLTIKIEPFAPQLIHANQTAFMKGRNIASGIMCLHEIMHETKRRKETGILFKIDFEKAYDKVSWKLLFDCLHMRGFNDKWCDWIKQDVTGGTVCIKINNSLGPYIKSFKGVRQGDPLSPILFNFAADCLTRMVIRAQMNGLLTGLVSHIIPAGVAILQYVDDTILCLKHDLDGARNMKLLLYMFELIAGLKINFSKSEILMINDNENWGQVYADIFNCQISTFPVKYLGVPISPSRLHVVDWLPLTEKCYKKLEIWKGGTLTMAGRATLIGASLNNAPMYHMSVYLLPKTTIKEMEKIRRTFFWQGGVLKKKYHLIRWPSVRKSKKKGGVGIKDLTKLNISLLSKWWWRLEKEEGLWQDLVRAKYLTKHSIHTVSHKLDDSPIWYDYLKSKVISEREKC